MINTMEDFKSKIMKTKNRVASLKYLKVKWQPMFLNHKKNTFLKRSETYICFRLNTKQEYTKEFTKTVL